MLDNFLAFIKSKKLFSAEDKVLLAVSGGLDSMVLTSLFQEAGWNFGIAHCNFQLRGEESDGDETLVKKIAESISVDFYSRKFETNKYAKQNKLSTQLAARDLRYEWFYTVLKNEGYNFIATAHHLNDSLETVLYNLTKGTGIHGITGIADKSGKIVRPLLFASRDEIEGYARIKNLKWREDRSNASHDYSRNKIRHNVINVLKEINPALEQTFEKTLQRLQSVGEIVNRALDNFKNDSLRKVGSDIYIDKKAAQAIEISVLDELLKEFGFNFYQVKSIKEGLVSEGQLFYSDSYVLNIDREELIVSEKLLMNHREEFIINEGIEHLDFDRQKLAIHKLNRERAIIRTDKKTALLDEDMLKYPLRLRAWREGDYFQPLGMTGKKKLSDFMIDCKIPLNLKKRVMVLESDENIVWVVGLRIDERYKVTSQTKNCLEIRLTSHD